MKKHKINIEKYRMKISISQNKLAKKVGISQSYLSAVERNKKSPTLRMLYKIAKELDVCPRLLICCTIKCNKCTTKYKCKCEGEEQWKQLVFMLVNLYLQAKVIL